MHNYVYNLNEELTLYIGIDPGLHGQIACIDEGGNILIYPLPHRHKQLDVVQFSTYLPTDGEIWIEQIECRPHQSVQSTRTSAMNYGKLLATFELLRLMYHEVTSRVWKAVLDG